MARAASVGFHLRHVPQPSWHAPRHRQRPQRARPRRSAPIGAGHRGGVGRGKHPHTAYSCADPAGFFLLYRRAFGWEYAFPSWAGAQTPRRPVSPRCRLDRERRATSCLPESMMPGNTPAADAARGSRPPPDHSRTCAGCAPLKLPTEHRPEDQVARISLSSPRRHGRAPAQVSIRLARFPFTPNYAHPLLDSPFMACLWPDFAVGSGVE